MGCKIIETKLTSAFQWYGELIGRRPFGFLVAPLIFTLLIGPGLLTMKYDDDVMMLFTPYSAPSRREQVIARQFSHIDHRNSSTKSAGNESKKFEWPLSSETPYSDIWFNIQVTSDKNLMTQHVWALISEFMHTVYDNFTCQVDDWVDDRDQQETVSDRKSFSSSASPYTLEYKRDFCNPERGCVQVQTMIDRVRDLLNTTKYGASGKVKLTYPVMYVWGHAVNWGQYIFGVKYNETTGVLESANMVDIYIQFQADRSDPRKQKAVQTCVRKLTTYTHQYRNDHPEVDKAGITFSPLNEFYVADEVARARDYSPPYLAVTIIFITIFIIVTSFKRRYAYWSLLGAVMGVSTVGLSLLASFGFLCLCGVHMNFVVMVTPFLVLCVGIDNDFLVTSAWRQTADNGRSSVARRLGLAFADCGPSLTITSVNDILCFGVGYLSETPAVADFCLHTCVALVFRFIFQLTFFAATIAYIGKKEQSIDQRILLDPNDRGEKWTLFSFFKSTSIAAAVDADPLPKKSIPSTLIDFVDFQRTASVVLQKQKRKEHQRIHEFFGQRYAPFLMRKSVRALTAAIYLIYVVLAVIGAASWIIDIAPGKLFYDGSPLQYVCETAEKFTQKAAVVGRVYVTAPPDFRSKVQVDRFLQFVLDLENIDDDNLSPNFTVKKTDLTDIWLRSYIEFLQFVRSTDDETDYQADFYEYLAPFLQSTDYNRFYNDLRFKRPNDHWNESTVPRLDKFQFVVSYFRSPQHPYQYDDHVEIMLKWRAVCRNYSEYDAIVFDNTQMNSYYDQRLTLAPTCLQTMGIALLCMSAVTALLMPDMRSMFFICLSFLSVDVGVIAGLKVWNTDLDPTSLAFVLMTIGFSVYYTARVCYCYQIADRRLSSEEKMKKTMETVGWPILQGAIATLVGICPVFLLQCYMIRVFYRTVILVVVIGLAHGLLIMPVCMSAFDRKSTPLSELRQNLNKRQQRRKRNESGQSPDTLSECSSE